MQNARLDELQARSKIAGRQINNLIYADDTTLMAESKEIKEPLDEDERGAWKSWLKTQHYSIVMDFAVYQHESAMSALL